VLTKNASRLKVTDGIFSFEFADKGLPSAVTIAYLANGYKTQILFYEFAPGQLAQNVIVLTRGKDSEIEMEDLKILRITRGVLPK